MSQLAASLLKLLTHRPTTAIELIDDLRAWQRNGIGDVLNRLDLLCITGKAVLVKGEGYRLPLPKPEVSQQKGLFA